MHKKNPLSELLKNCGENGLLVLWIHKKIDVILVNTRKTVEKLRKKRENVFAAYKFLDIVQMKLYNYI